ncbi:hypothetical protein Pst134EB_001317 [Puccinia striiformis f. sp. tritici]|nr:hypothetical protein Pst134EB_001317 [Puccinia striiformis f. sp. tritici]
MVRTTAAQQRVQPTPTSSTPSTCTTKAYLPLGRDKWTHVLDQYNRYATSNNRSSRDLEPLKIKFRALVNHTKPTGDPDCPTYVREAKYAQRDMDKRAHVIACADESDDEANGVGAHVSMSVDSDNPNVDEESFGTNTQPNDDQTRMASLIPGLDAYGDDDDDEEEEEEETEPSTPANTPGNRTASMQAPRSSATPTFSPWGQRSVSSSSGSHRNPLVHRVQTRGDTEPPRNPAPGARARASTQSPQGGLKRNLMAYFDPQARDRREQTNGLNDFLQMCLQDARAENSRLTREITQLREAETTRVTQLRDNNSRLQEKISEQKFKIQSLQGKLELMQVRLDMMSRGNPMFHSQPAPLYHYPLNHQSQGPSNSSTASTSARPENCDDVDPET